jgi:hypothetical protein
MNEPWENQDNRPESIKVSDELAKSKDSVHLSVSKTWKCNWDDALARVATNLFGWLWRGK